MVRTKWLQIVFLILFLLLAGRLYYIQILCGQELKTAAKCQQMIPVLQENRRWTIYDRHMHPLTETEQVYYYLIHEENLNADAQRLLEQMGAAPAGKKGSGYRVYCTDDYQSATSGLLQNQYRAYAFAASRRCGVNQVAKALIEDFDQMYASMMQRDEPAFYFLGNAAGGMIYGAGVAENESVQSGGEMPAALFTTIDFALQKKVEALFADNGATGCAVVTDTATGQILAMVSRGGDDFNQNLAVEKAYSLGDLCDIIKSLSSVSKSAFEETAREMGLGAAVFSNYPGEDTGSLAGRRSAATAVQVSQLLTILANQGKKIPLTMILSAAPEETALCMSMNEKTSSKMSEVRDALVGTPLTDAGWAAGYDGTYAAVLHLDKGSPRKLYSNIMETL